MLYFELKFGGISNYAAGGGEYFELQLVIEGYIYSVLILEHFSSVLLCLSTLEHRNTEHSLCCKDFSKQELMSCLLGFVLGSSCCSELIPAVFFCSSYWSLHHF